MAETQKPREKTAGNTDVTPALPSSSTPLGDRQFFAPQDLTAPAEAGYQTLSLLALVGFIIGSTFAIVIAITAIVALFAGKPMLMVGWTFVFPVAAVVLCVIAKIRIAQSEGTLAGGKLANWGLMASLLVGLCAWAYQTAVYFALKQQSETAIMEWVDLIREGEFDKALLRTLPRQIRSEFREDDPKLGTYLSQRISKRQEGGFQNEVASYSQRQYIRAIAQGGAEARVEPRGVKQWEYSSGGYVVVWSFQVSTRELEVELEIRAHGVDSPNPEEGRVWTISEVGIISMEQTEFGKLFARRIKEASSFWVQWAPKLLRGEKLEAFLDTVPETRRKVARAELGRAAALGALGSGGSITALTGADAAAFAEYRRFLAGGLVTLDDKRFVGIQAARDALAPRLREQFARSSASYVLADLQLPPMRIEGDGRVQFEFQTVLTIPQESGPMPSPEHPLYLAHVLVVLECDAQALASDSGRANWRMAGIKVIGGQQVTGPPKAPPPGGR